jgi:hypothetical protein
MNVESYERYGLHFVYVKVFEEKIKYLNGEAIVSSSQTT